MLLRGIPRGALRGASLRAAAARPALAPSSLALPTPTPAPRVAAARFASSSHPLDRVRRLAHASQVPALQGLPSAAHKPPKRRLEAASAPLRNNPAPTRGPILQCIAHTTAERYDLSRLGAVLRRMGVRWEEVPEGDRERAFVIGPWKGRGGAERLVRGKDVPATSEDEELDPDMGFEYGERGEIWVFNGGSFVTWGLTEEEGRAFERDVLKRRGAGIEVEPLSPEEYEVEEVDFVVDPSDKTQIVGNLILLGGPPELSTFPPSPGLASLLARYTLSLSLSRSSSLSVLEGRLDRHIASVSRIPRALALFGQQPLERRDVIRKMGELMVLRMAVNTRGGGLEETPEFYWSEPELESYFDSIASEFEIKERIEAINKKIDYAQEVQNTLRALLTESSGHRMELIIIALIAVEVIIVLIREGPELFEHARRPIVDALDAWFYGKDAVRARKQKDAEYSEEHPEICGSGSAVSLAPASDRRLV